MYNFVSFEKKKRSLNVAAMLSKQVSADVILNGCVMSRHLETHLVTYSLVSVFVDTLVAFSFGEVLDFLGCKSLCAHQMVSVGVPVALVQRKGSLPHGAQG